MAEFKAWRDAPKRGETDAGWMACKYVNGHQSGDAVSGHRTKTAALLAAGAPLKTYDVEVRGARAVNAQGAFNFLWVRDVPCYEMSADAALEGVHELTNFALGIGAVRTIWATVKTQEGN